MTKITTHLKNKSGFTLIELMVVVVIVGVLGAIGIASYQKYVVRSKMAEAYVIMDAIRKNQIAYFSEHLEFFHLGGHNLPQYIQPPLVVEAIPEWASFGYPVPVGSNVHFSYRTWAGKIDNSGTEVTAQGDSVSGQGFTNLNEDGMSRGHYTDSGPTCNGSISAETLGAVSQSSYDWAVVYAVGELNGKQESLCTALAQLITVAAPEKTPVSTGFMVMNTGY